MQIITQKQKQQPNDMQWLLWFEFGHALFCTLNVVLSSERSTTGGQVLSSHSERRQQTSGPADYTLT